MKPSLFASRVYVVPAQRLRTAQTTQDQAAVSLPGSYLARPLQPFRLVARLRLHQGLSCHPETMHRERPLHFHRGSQDKVLSHPPDIHTQQVNDGNQVGSSLTCQPIQATHETPSSLAYTREENYATSFSALSPPTWPELLPHFNRGKYPRTILCSSTSPIFINSLIHSLLLWLLLPQGHHTPLTGSHQNRQSSFHPNSVRTRLSLAETGSRRARKERKKEARSTTDKTRCPWRTVFTGNPHGISWKQSGAVFFSQTDLCLPSPEPLALEAGQRKIDLC